MRKRTLLGLALAGIAAVVAVRNRLQRRQSKQLSPINEPVPGDEPIREEDIPEDRE